jgi:uncharacterized membrane protein YeaQ/YmgE (transglycosylase-associated protein family)
MIFWAGLIGAAVGSAVGASLKRRGHRQAPLLAATAAAIVFILLTVIGEVLS